MELTSETRSRLVRQIDILREILQEMPSVNNNNNKAEQLSSSSCGKDISIDQLPAEIQQMIIKNVDSVDELLQCRLVCQNWRDFATQELKIRHGIISFLDGDDLTSFLTAMENHPDSQQFPFTKFNFVLSSLLPSGVDELEKFFDLYGSHLQHLGLEIGFLCPLMSLDELIPLLPTQLLHQTPNLTELYLNIEMEATTEQANGLTVLLPPILPNLKILEFELYSSEPHDPWIEFLTKLKDASPNLQQVRLSPSNDHDLGILSARLNIFRNTPRIGFTRNVRLSVEAVQEFTQSLRNPHPIQLTELQLTLSNSSPRRTNLEDYRLHFQSMLEAQSPTLKVFKLCTISIDNFRIPPLGTLESLIVEFRSDFGDVPRPPITPLTPANFPKLKSVTLHNYKQIWRLFGTEPFPKVTKLEIAHFERDENEHVFHPWAEIFPSLEILELIDLGMEDLIIFMSQLSFISHLKLLFHIKPGNLIDQCKERRICNLLTMPLSIQGTKTLIPSLGDFLNLKTFELHGTYWMVKAIVTITRCGYFKPLKCVTLKSCDDISRADVEILNSVHHSVKWVNN